MVGSGWRAPGPWAALALLVVAWFGLPALESAIYDSIGGRLFNGVSPGLLGRVVCAAQLIETQDGLVLVDTGYGVQDVEHPHPRTSRLFHALLNIRFRIQDTALFQLQARGFAASDVRHIVLTHLAFDHADGIEDFPQAPVHVLAREREAAERRRRSFIARRRYRPAQFDAVCDWRTYAAGGEPWFGFEAVRALEGLPPEILMVTRPSIAQPFLRSERPAMAP